jgi:iron(III) transport system substrate-binding protein
MNKIKMILLVQLLAAAAFAQTTVKWVGQFPTEQAQPVVELFNTKYANELGFKVEYTYDDKVIANLTSGVTDLNYDLVHMKDAEMLNTIGVKGLTDVLTLDTAKAWSIQYKDLNNRWVALLKRSRIIYYNSELVQPENILTYESLGEAQFKDKLCLRQKKAQYSTGLYSFFVGVWGAEKTTEVLKKWAVNTENVPLIEKDLDGVIAGIETDKCLVGIANTYYYVRHLAANPNTKVKAMIPNQNDVGAHVNIDGVAVLKNSVNKTLVNLFVNWLTTAEAQLKLSDITGKHPANSQVRSEKLDNIFGEFNDNTTFDLNQITQLKDEALKIATEQGLK